MIIIVGGLSAVSPIGKKELRTVSTLSSFITNRSGGN